MRREIVLTSLQETVELDECDSQSIDVFRTRSASPLAPPGARLQNSNMRSFLSLLLFPCVTSMDAGVTGRYVRLEAPVSQRMELHEIEVYSRGTNIAFTNNIVFAGVGARGIDINHRRASVRLNDGQKDTNSRGLRIETGKHVNPWLEVDLGASHPIDEVIIYRSKEQQYHDRHQRLLTILDAQRRIVSYIKFDVRNQEFKEGIMKFAAEPTKSVFAQYKISANASEWIPLGDFLDVLQPPELPDAADRRAAFEARNSPEAVNDLAHRFFARVDLKRSQLADVRARYEAADYPGALDAFRDHFFKKIQGLENLSEHSNPTSMYASQAEDLMNGIAVAFEQSHNSASVQAFKFEPGLMPWASIPKNVEEQADTLTIARTNAYINHLQRPLLWAYTDSGQKKYLDRWAAITDDWAMNFVRDADAALHDIRHYFVKEGLQQFSYFCYELDQIASKHKRLQSDFPSTTLARLLMLVAEEYPPAYWRVCRKAVFNHTYNALIAAVLCGDILDELHAGQRLTREARQHMERIWTYGISRDGSMMEIGDEGHLTMHLRVGRIYRWLLKKNPPWLTEAFKTRFEDGWRTTCTYVIRHITPSGHGHRFSDKDMFSDIWSLTRDENSIGGQNAPSKTWHDPTIFSQPEVRAILDTVYGRGHKREGLVESRQTAWDEVTGYYGSDYKGPPKMLSDWLPYAGLHYLRSGWGADDSFLHMFGQKAGSESSNPSEWNTELRFWSHGNPQLRFSALTIDGKKQHPDYRRKSLAPGSKTSRLTQAPQTPVTGRWYSSEDFDFAESSYDGVYQNLSEIRFGQLNEQNLPTGEGQEIQGAQAVRQVLQHRPSKLFIVIDRVKFDDPAVAHRVGWTLNSWLPEKRDPDSSGLKPDEQKPGINFRHLSSAEIEPAGDNGPSGHLNYSAQTKGEFLLVTVLQSSQGKPQSFEDLTNEEKLAFTIPAPDGGELSFSAAKKVGDLNKNNDAEVLLKWRKPEGKLSGIWFGMTGNEDEFGYEFSSPGLLTLGAIRRPIVPVQIEPDTQVFAGSLEVTLHTQTRDTEIRYTLDGSDPVLNSALYDGPFSIRNDTLVKARAILNGVQQIPFTMAGTKVSAISYAEFKLQQPAGAMADVSPEKLQPGLRYDYLEENWFRLFSYANLPGVLPTKLTGTTEKLLDVSMRQTDGAFGVRYSGYLRVPTTGVYTFHGPDEYVQNICEPGYDLRVYVDGKEWYLGQSWHGLGRWSVPLEEGLHPFMVTYADARARDVWKQKTDLWRGYPTPWVVWQGKAPELEVSGPGLKKQPVPGNWLWYEAGK